MTTHSTSLLALNDGHLARCSCGWADPNGPLPLIPATVAAQRHEDEAPATFGRLRVFTLTPSEARILTGELTHGASSAARIRIGFDGDGVKVDVGHGWTPGFGSEGE
jgi:hypothetical protein